GLGSHSRPRSTVDALEQLTARSRPIFETEHPVVCVHPETRERVLMLGGWARNVVGFSAEDSAAILSLLQAHIVRPENIVRWHWRDGDVVMWDNRATQHCVITDFGQTLRRLRRVSLTGDIPQGVDGRCSRSIRGDASCYAPETEAQRATVS